MIECSNCETARFLQIVYSRIRLTDDGQIHEITERYECTSCETRGEVREGENGTRIEGGIRDNDDLPKVRA